MAQIALPDTYPPAFDGPTRETEAVTGPVAESAQATRRARRVSWLDPASLVPTYVGAVVVAVGFALIGVAWAQIAALTDVALQMPYLVSAGFTGLGLVMLGLIIINVSAKRQDGAERARQMQTLTEALHALREEVAREDQADE